MRSPQFTVQRSRTLLAIIVGLLLPRHQGMVLAQVDQQQEILFPTRAPTESTLANVPPVFLPTTNAPPDGGAVPTFQISFPNEPLISPTAAPTRQSITFTQSPTQASRTSSFTQAPVATAVSAAPISAAPISAAPITAAPISAAPTSTAPISAAPISAAPVSAAPVSAAPVAANIGGTAAPVVSPTVSAWVSRTEAPVATVTNVPVIRPTPAPLLVFPTEVSGSIPTIPAVTIVPTVVEPRAVKATVQGVTMTFTGITSMLSPYDADIFGEVYSEWFDQYFDSRRRRRLQSLYGVTNMVSGLDLTNQQLTPNGNTLTFTQSLDYTVLPNLAPPPEEVVLLPFQTPNDRKDLVNTLQVGVDSFRPLQSVTPPIVIPDNGPVPKKGSTWATPPVIAGIAGGGALLIGTIAFLAYCFCWGESGKAYEGDAAEESPLQNFQFTSGSEDNVSAFDVGEEGTPSKPSLLGNNSDALSVGNYGEQSVATVDYDYTTAYAGGTGSGSVVSSVGGTLGDATRLTAEPPSGASLGASYEAMRGVQEEVIVIEAPPGKLGVVIDTPDDGAPLVHAVKDSSVIADLIQVGDKLLAVDDDDVQAMTAIKVSKLISKRSGNPVRRLTIVRTTHVGAV